MFILNSLILHTLSIQGVFNVFFKLLIKSCRFLILTLDFLILLIILKDVFGRNGRNTTTSIPKRKQGTGRSLLHKTWKSRITAHKVT